MSREARPAAVSATPGCRLHRRRARTRDSDLLVEESVEIVVREWAIDQRLEAGDDALLEAGSLPTT